MYGVPMSNAEDAEEFAKRVVDTMGAAEALFMAMRLVLLVGQRAEPQTPELLEAAQNAVAAIKSVGQVTGVLKPSS